MVIGAGSLVPLEHRDPREKLGVVGLLGIRGCLGRVRGLGRRRGRSVRRAQGGLLVNAGERLLSNGRGRPGSFGDVTFAGRRRLAGSHAKESSGSVKFFGGNRSTGNHSVNSGRNILGEICGKTLLGEVVGNPGGFSTVEVFICELLGQVQALSFDISGILIFTLSVIILDGSDEVQTNIASKETGPFLSPVIVKQTLIGVVRKHDVTINVRHVLGSANTARTLVAAINLLGGNHIVRSDMVRTHPPDLGVRGIGAGRIKTIQMKTARTVVASDNGTCTLGCKTTLGAADAVSLVVVFSEKHGIRVSDRAVLLGWFSQPRQVGRGLVVALVLQIPGIFIFKDNSFIHSLEMFLDILGKLEFGLLVMFRVCDQGRETVADGALGAVPLSLRRILGIQGRVQAVEMVRVNACVATE
jgi:hypothetical protein